MKQLYKFKICSVKNYKAKLINHRMKKLIVQSLLQLIDTFNYYSIQKFLFYM